MEENMFETGRVCMKIAGREAGSLCVVLKKIDENFVIVTGPKELTGVKRRRCNIDHLEPLMERIKIKQDAADSEVVKALEKEGVLERLGVKVPEKAGKKKPEAKEKEKEKQKEKTKATAKAGKEKKEAKKQEAKASKKPAKDKEKK